MMYQSSAAICEYQMLYVSGFEGAESPPLIEATPLALPSLFWLGQRTPRLEGLSDRKLFYTLES